jgi:hypothetical protein
MPCWESLRSATSQARVRSPSAARADAVGENAADRIAGEAPDGDRPERKPGDLEVDVADLVQVDDEERKRQAAADRGERVSGEHDPRIAREIGKEAPQGGPGP